MTTTTFYLDESGNTGGLNTRGGLSFAGQPLFVLACLGVDDVAALAAEVARLRTKHKIQAPEFKFASVRGKPAFVAELADFIHVADLPVMIEATDKRYLICIHVIECLIMPPYSPNDFGPKARAIKNVFADYLAFFAPDNVLLAFIQACEQETYDGLKAAFAALNAWLASLHASEVTDGLRLFATDTYGDFQALAPGDPKMFDHYLPAPDVTRRGNRVWMLSHVMSLMINIYARINMMRGRDLASVRLVHDEQMQFDNALFDGKALSEGATARDLPPMPMADFTFDARASLEFRNSSGELGIQIADVLAGAVGHCTRPFLETDGELPHGWRDAMRALAQLDDERRARGTNFVLPTETLWRLKESYA